MLLSIRTSILTVAAFTAFTAPVLAAGTTAVTPPISQAVKSPPTVAPAKPEAAKAALIVAPAAKTAPIVAPAKPEVVKEVVKAAPAVPAVPAARNEHPDNEQLAVQITKLRLNVIGLDREMTDVKKEIRKMKVTLARNGRPVRVAANSKGRKHMAKRGHHHAAAHASTKKTARLHAGASKTSKATLTLPPAPPAM